MPRTTRLPLHDESEPATGALDGRVMSEGLRGKIEENIRKHFDFVVS